MSSTHWSSGRIAPAGSDVRTDGTRPAGSSAAEPRRASRLAVVGAAFVLLVLVVAGSVALGALIEASVAVFAPR